MGYQIHQLAGVTGVQMMSYVITTPAGGVYCIDGGYEKDSEYLVNYIKKVSGSNHVDGWFLTHPHSDHIHALLNILDNTPDALDIAKIYYNDPEPDFIHAHCYDEGEYRTALWLRKYAENNFGGKGVKCHTGDSFSDRDISVEVLFEPDPMLAANVTNNAGVVFRFTLGDKTFLVTGDLGIEGGKICIAHYGKHLKSDIVEMAHHGQNGVDKEFYQLVQPKVCMWPTPQWLWDNNAGKGYDTHGWKTIVVRGWMSEMGVRRHVAAKDGDQILEVDEI